MMNPRATCSFVCAAFAAAISVAGLAGCFSEHTTIAPPTGEELCTGPQPADVVRIVNFAFSPAQVTVPRGSKVTWVNCGANGVQHTSTADAGAWDSGFLVQFATYEREFTAAGSFPYHCQPHPTMKGTVVVQ
jgi:plastocyanin